MGNGKKKGWRLSEQDFVCFIDFIGIGAGLNWNLKSSIFKEYSPSAKYVLSIMQFTGELGRILLSGT